MGIELVIHQQLKNGTTIDIQNRYLFSYSYTVRMLVCITVSSVTTDVLQEVNLHCESKNQKLV